MLHRVWQALNDLPQGVLLSGGRFYGGGLYKLEPKEVMAIPIDTLERCFKVKSMQGKSKRASH